MQILIRLFVTMIFITSIITYDSLLGQDITDQFEYRMHAAYGKTIPYRLFIPKDYNEENQYPLVLTLHGFGKRGIDNEAQIDGSLAKVWAQESTQEIYPNIVVSPQFPTEKSWRDELDILCHLVYSLLEELSIDTTRLYVTGQSMGGYGTWDFMTYTPFHVAAIVPMSGGGSTEPFKLLSYIPPIWNFHGEVDGTVPVQESRKTITALENLLNMEAVYTDLKNGESTPLSGEVIDSLIRDGARLINTEYADQGHVVWDESYTNPKLMPWIFSHKSDFLIKKVPASLKTQEKSKLVNVTNHPVLTYGESGSWDEFGVNHPVVIKDNDTLRMWYVGMNNSKSQIGYAWSIDGISWTRYKQNPVFSTELPLEGNNVSDFALIKDDGVYKMWYSTNMSMYFPTSIGYATSNDGVNWIRHPAPVLLSNDSLDWGYPNIAPGTVIKEENIYKMWYYAGNWYTNFQIGIALSLDGINWEKYDDPKTSGYPFQNSDPILKIGQLGVDWDFDRVFFPSVQKKDDGYEMWYVGSNISNSFICYATSDDGYVWSKSESNPILVEPPNWSESGLYYGGSVQNFDFQNHIWYGYIDNPFTYKTYEGRPQIGYARDVNKIAHVDSIMINKTYAQAGSDSLRIKAYVENPSSHSLEVKGFVKNKEQIVIDSLLLFDNGQSTDETEDDGIWSGIWPTLNEENSFSVCVQVSDQDTGTVYLLNKSKYFTTIGPIKLNYFELKADTVANPGDQLYMYVYLKNDGISAPAKSLTATLTTRDTFVTINPLYSTQNYADIAPGETIKSKGLYRINISDGSFPHTPYELRFALDIQSDGISFWKDTLTIPVIHVGLEEENDIIPSEFDLSQNYPNPFNPSTTINYSLPKQSYITLKVYDILGREVASLVQEQQKAGYYEVDWNAKDLTSGIYFISIRAEGINSKKNFTQVKKALLLK